MNKVREMNKAKRLLLKKLESKKVQYKMVSSSDCADLVLYPDNYSEDGVWFCLCRFYDEGDTEFLAEDKDGNSYDQYTEDEFLDFVKDFKL